MTVREILDFSGRCLGVGMRYDTLAVLTRREIEAGIKPDPEIDAFMKATAFSGQKTSLVTDYVLRVLVSLFYQLHVITLSSFLSFQCSIAEFFEIVTDSWIGYMC